MEALFSLLIIVLFFLWLTQHKTIDQNTRELHELEAKLSAWSTWGYSAHRHSGALQGQLDSVKQRLEVLEARLAQSTDIAPTSVETVTPVPEVVAATASTSVAATPTAMAIPPTSDEPTVTTTPETLETVTASSSDSHSAELATAQLVGRAADFAEPAEPARVAASDTATRHDVAPNTESSAFDFKGFRGPTVDWESLIGVRLFSWIAGLSLLLGAVFFLRYSAESGWLNPPVRMAMGFLVGIALLVACEWKGQRYRVTANAMDAAGIGTLFATSFAAYAVWHLLPAAVAMGLLVLVTCVAVLLAIRRNSLFIALLGLVGGFSTPILLSTGENHPFGLFGYLLLLNVGLAVVGYRQRWPILTCLSLVFTTLYQWGWIVKFVLSDAAELPIAVGVFLLFPLVWLGSARLLGKKDPAIIPPWLSRLVTYSAALPLLLALVMAWVPAFGERYLLLFAYLFVLDTALLALDYFRPKDHLGLVASGATGLVWVTWVSLHYASECWPIITAIFTGFVLLFLARVWVAKRLGGPTSTARFTAPSLLGIIALLLAVEPLTASPFIPFGVLLGLFGAVATTAIYARDGKLYYTAVPFVVLAEAVWSGKYLDDTRLTSGLIVYLLSALLCIGIPIVARRLGRPIEPCGLSVFVPVLNLVILFFLALGPVAAHSLWVIGVLLVVLNVGCFIEAHASRRHPFAFFGIALSWLVVGLWWTSAIRPEQLVLALVIVLTLVLLEVGGLLWLLRSRDEDPSRSPFEQSPLLGLVGHLFLLFVASQPKLGNPPWPLFAIAFLLDLGLIAASLYLRRALFAMTGLAVSMVIFGVWAVAQTTHFPPLLTAEVALLAATIVVVLSESLPLISQRRTMDAAPLVRGRNVILLLAFGLLAALALLTDPPRTVGLVVAQAALLGLLMRSSRASGQHGWVLAGWAGTILLAATWSLAHFTSEVHEQLLAIAVGPYALQTLYPVFCAARAKPCRFPFVIAVAGSFGFFALGYAALRVSPLQNYLGALPLLESVVASGLLVYVLRVTEPTPPRDIGRVALLAAVALGFATAAIPLQLENEWLTVAWALETTALAWLYRRLRHVGLLWASLGLAIAVTVRLSANPEVFIYHTRSQTPVFNFYLYAYGVSAAALFGAAAFLGKPSEPRFRWLRNAGQLLNALATLLLFLLLNIEIADYFSEGSSIVFRFSSTLAQDLTYTLGWALFAIAMLVAGILCQGRAVRIAALVLLTATIAKCFLHDLWRLGGLYRVGSFVGLALCLAFVAILLQRFVLRTKDDKAKS